MTNTPDKSELKACPFCGGKAGIGERSYSTPRRSGVKHAFTANCTNPRCLAVVAGLESFDTQAEAIAAWNTRSRPPADQVPDMRQLLDISGIRQLEDDVHFCSGNADSGRNAIVLRKAEAWERAVAALQAVPATSGEVE